MTEADRTEAGVDALRCLLIEAGHGMRERWYDPGPPRPLHPDCSFCSLVIVIFETERTLGRWTQATLSETIAVLAPHLQHPWHPVRAPSVVADALALGPLPRAKAEAILKTLKTLDALDALDRLNAKYPPDEVARILARHSDQAKPGASALEPEQLSEPKDP